jgi:catechol 2,3-dioxygenase-like lactoylglutathione lyase family enzyme
MQLGRFEVGLDVQDIERSLAFYEKLGFRVVDGAVANRFVSLENGDCRLSLYQGHLDPAQTQLIFWQGDVEAIANELATKSLTFERAPARHDDGGIGALLRDPDGHPIYFVNIPSAGSPT